MLNHLRKNTKLICWIIVGAFALWGVGSIAFEVGSKGNFAGKVFGQKISNQEFNRHYKMVQIFGGDIGENKDPELLEAKTWQQIALVLEARQKGIQVSDEEVRSEIMRRMAGGTGTYDEEVYERWVKNVFRETPRAFEEKIRDLISIQKLLGSLPSDPTQRQASLIAIIREAKIQSYLEKEAPAKNSPQ